ncbi:MAG: Holliday junction resolvase RuvX [Acidobacteriota bacterium]
MPINVAALPADQPPRALGIDFGERRIGLAISDDKGRFAVPHGAIERDTDRRAVYRIADLARREEAGWLVLGEPLRPDDGEAGEAAERIRRFAAKLERAARLPVVLIDEAHTTLEAIDRLGAAGNDTAERRDAVAAQILLQEALDRRWSDR